MALMTAMDAIHAAGPKIRANTKFVFEGEEEAGSLHLEQILADNKELFSGDLWLMYDGPLHQTRRQLWQLGDKRDSVIGNGVNGHTNCEGDGSTQDA